MDWLASSCKGYLVGLIAILGGFLLAGAVEAALLKGGVLLNYRELGAGGDALVLLGNFILLYGLSVYTIALLLRQVYPDRRRPKAVSRRPTRLKFILPASLILALVLLNYEGFPGFASAETRQQWAYKEFSQYK